MKNINIGKSGLLGSSIAIGCMGINKLNTSELDSFIKTAIQNNITFFDHADIYGEGDCELKFGQFLANNKHIREKIIIQSKCGIRDGYYDFSKEHILSSVDEILKRLNIDYLDSLLLHRPDTLMDPHEVSDAFDMLQNSGKVKHFGVSNFNPLQIQLLQASVKQKILINQLQFSLMHCGIISSGILVNTSFNNKLTHEASILEYCMLNNITIQAWSPFRYGFFEGIFIDNPKFPVLNKILESIAEKYNTSKSSIALSWILTHPANMQAIIGTTNIDRLKQICNADKIQLTRKEWYQLYSAAGNEIP